MKATTCTEAYAIAPAPIAEVIPRGGADGRFTEAPQSVAARLADYIALTKPRIAVLVLFTVGVGALLAPGGLDQPLLVLHALLGTAFVAAGASALNQLLERSTDAHMQRTENRPLPAGRIQPFEAFLFGVVSAMAGLLYLSIMLPQIWAAIVAAVTLLSYVFIYTPLKRRTTYNTLVGAIPGALPPVIGWAAMPGALSFTGASGWKLLTLFLVLLCWQIPHFMAIAWLYRADYARAGLRMVPVRDRTGRLTSRHMVVFCLALIAVSLLPAFLGSAGPLYLCGSLALGTTFLFTALVFRRRCGTQQARRVLRVSLIYLPALLALLLLDLMVTWN
jgi:protoheme IX farnesyltransferase